MKKIKLLLCFMATLCFASPDDCKLVAWNLQGSSVAAESEWNIIVSGANTS